MSGFIRIKGYPNSQIPLKVPSVRQPKEMNIFVTPKLDYTTHKSMDDTDGWLWACDKIDDTTQKNEMGADNAKTFSYLQWDYIDNLHTLKVENLDDLIQQLTELKAGKAVRIKYLYFSSHGSYNDPSFYIGSHYDAKGKWGYKNRFGIDNVTQLGQLAPFLYPTTQVLLMACHSGGGKKASDSEKFVQAVSKQLGVTVFANRSWGLASTGNFKNNLYAYTKALYGGENTKQLYKKKPNAFKFMGTMLKATPDGGTEITNPLILKPDGSFAVMQTDYNASLQKVLQNIKDENYYNSKKEMLDDKDIDQK